MPPRPFPHRRPSSRWLVYILRCSDGSLYTGITNDLPSPRCRQGLEVHPQPAPRQVGLQRAPAVEIGCPEAGGGDQEAASGREGQVGGTGLNGRQY
jgi:hypothetical protein